MDLSALLLRFAARTPHVLTVPVAGREPLRMDLEQEIARRGWREATGPSDADLVLVAGTPGPEMASVVADLWRRVPAPRVQLDIPDEATATEVAALLDAAPSLLADASRARQEARVAAGSVDAAPASDEHQDHEDHSAHEHSAHEDHSAHGGHGGHEDHSAHGGHGGHGGHEGHDMSMALPGGLVMADLAPDRDGLMLDALTLALGPVLPDWPAGLVVDVVMQGDVISAARGRVLDRDRVGVRTTTVPPLVRELDILGRTLAVAGWQAPAARTRDLRDRLRAGVEVADDLVRLVRTVRRSRTLRLMLRDVRAGGRDVAELLEQRLARIEALTRYVSVHEGERQAGDETAVSPAVPVAVPVAGLETYLVGAEFAAARLIVASLDLRVDPQGPGTQSQPALADIGPSQQVKAPSRPEGAAEGEGPR